MSEDPNEQGLMADVNPDAVAPPDPNDPDITSITEDEIDMIERLVFAEAGTEGEEGRDAVRGVIFNRLSSDRFPNSVREVIEQRGQFEPIGTHGSVENIPVPEDKLESQKYEMDAYLNTGIDASGGRTFFLNKDIAKRRGTDFSGDKPLTIGKHTFYSGYPGQEPVRVSPTSHNITVVDSRPGTIEQLMDGTMAPVISEEAVAPASDQEALVADTGSQFASLAPTNDTASTPSPRLSTATDDVLSNFTTRDRSDVGNQTRSMFNLDAPGTMENYDADTGRVNTGILQSIREALGFAEGGMAVSGNQDIEPPQGDGSVLLPYEPTLQEKAKYAISGFLQDKFGMGNYEANDLSEKFTGNPNATDGSYGIGLADFTPAGLVFGADNAKDNFERAKNTDDRLGMGLAVGEGALSVAEAFPLTKLAARGAKQGIETLADIAKNMDPNTVGSLGGNVLAPKKRMTDATPVSVVDQTEEVFNLEGGPNKRVDTRLPAQSVREDDLQTGAMVSDTSALLGSNTKMNENFAMMAENYPGLKNLWSEDVAETAANVKGQMTDNIVSLYDMSDKLGIAEESAQWYRGANRIANGLADRFDLNSEQTSGVLAVMSPQKDWYQNVALAERLIKHHTELGPNAPWTQAMDDITTTVPASRKAKGNTAFQDGKNGTVLDQIKGKTWGDLETPEQKAMWLRAYDEAHFGKNYREVSPEGDILGYAVKKSGEPAGLVHQGFGDIAKAVRILEGDGSIKSISPELGGNHKVRNFYNNIYNPDSPVDVTVDTHQIAAGLMRPLGSSSVEVTHGLNGSNIKGNPARWSNDGKADSGMAGSYGLYFDATADAAKLRGVLPREMQSVSWEQLRTLFPVSLKNNKGFVQSTEAIWRMADEGQLTADGARNMIIAEAEKLGAGGAPSWKTYAGAVRDIGVPAAGLIGAAGLATAEEAPEEFSRGGLTQGESEKGIRTKEGKEMADKVFKLDFSKADLNDDGKLSEYEKARGEAIQKATSEEDGIMKAYHGGMPCGCGGDCDGSCGDDGSMPGMIVGTDPVSGNEIPLGSEAENVRDDIPAMLSEGEYVLPADVVKWHGLKHISGMMMEAKAGLMSLQAMGQIHEVEEVFYDEEEEYSDDMVECPECGGEGCEHCDGMGYHTEAEESYETPEGNEVDVAEVITEEETPEYDEEEDTVETISYAMKSTPKIAFIR